MHRKIDPEDARAYRLTLKPQGKNVAVQVIGALDRLSIPGGYDITDENSRARGRSVRVDAHDENAAPAARRLRPIGRAFLPYGLEASAEITAKDMASRQELIDGAVDS